MEPNVRSSAKVAVVLEASEAVGTGVTAALEARDWTCVGFGRDEASRYSMAVDGADIDAAAGAIDAITAEFGEVDCLVSAFAPVKRLEPTEISLSVWREVLEAHLDGLSNVARAVLRGMMARGRGDIITIVSAAVFGGRDHGAHQAAAGGAVLGFTKALAIEVAASGVQVNTVVAGTGAEPKDADPVDAVSATVRYLAEERTFFTGQVLSSLGRRMV